MARVLCKEIVHASCPRKIQEVQEKSGHLFRLETEVLIPQDDEWFRKYGWQSPCCLKVCCKFLASHCWFPAPWPGSAKLRKRWLHPRIEHPARIPHQKNHLRRKFLHLMAIISIHNFRPWGRRCDLAISSLTCRLSSAPSWSILKTRKPHRLSSQGLPHMPTLLGKGDRLKTNTQLPGKGFLPYNFSKVSSCASSWGMETWRGGEGKAWTHLERSNYTRSGAIQAAPFLLLWVRLCRWRENEVAQNSRRCQGRHWGDHPEKLSHFARLKPPESEGADTIQCRNNHYILDKWYLPLTSTTFRFTKLCFTQ